MSDLQTFLESLTRQVCKTLNQIALSVKEPDIAKRDKKVGRILKELELVNDAAMMGGLNLPIHRIAQLKTASRGASKKQQPSEPRALSPFQQLMEFHSKHIVGPIPDAAAQGSAIKWILASFTPELAMKRYETQLLEPWRNGHVNWLTVKQDIGRMNRNGARDSTERNESRRNDSFDLLAELRGEGAGDIDQGEHGTERTH